MTGGIRVIPTQPLGHSSDCRICSAVDRWVANGNLRLRPATRSGHFEFQLPTGETVLLDQEDAHLAAQKWSRFVCKTTVYAVRHGGDDKRTFLHRVVLDAPAGTRVDHRNGNGLDNRRSNLRLATAAQNNQNRRPGPSGVKGVRQRPNGRWAAYIQLNGHLRHLGTFDSREDAARAYDEAAVRLFGDFARPNALPVRPLGPGRTDLAGVGTLRSRDDSARSGSPVVLPTTSEAAEHPPSQPLRGSSGERRQASAGG